MRKVMQKLFVLLIVPLLLIPHSAYAHSKLTSSVPEDGQTVTEELRELVLVFNTPIEPLSTLTVSDEQGADYKMADIRVEDAEMIGTLEQPLGNGVYTVQWKIIGGDGHPVEGAFTFRVELSNNEHLTESSNATSNEETSGEGTSNGSAKDDDKAASEAPAEMPDTDKQETQSEPQPQQNASWMNFAVAVVLLAALAVAIAVFKRLKW